MSTTKLATRDSFRVEMRSLNGDPSKRQNHVVITCRKCPAEDAIPITTRSPHIPSEFAAKMFRKRGWSVGGSRNKDVCPACHGLAKAASQPPENQHGLLLDAAVYTVSNALAKFEIIPEEAIVEAKPSPANAPTAVGAALVEAAMVKSGLKTKPGRGDGDRLRRVQASMTPEQRSAATAKGHETRRARAAAKKAETAAKQGEASRRYWESMTPEERSQRQKNAARTRLIRQGKLAPDAPNPVLEIAPVPATAAAVATPVPLADPPRTATPAENRRIIEALDVHYNTIQQRYIGTWTDKKVAEDLGLPWAWVAEMRERVYGPERNEAAELAGAELKKQWEALGKLETDVLTAFDKFDEQIKTQRAALQKLAATLGVTLA
ncbi:hypothetical protein Ccr2_gp189c [Caulobacter phage Ccr2]|nr:hypothetical protein Ccr10_gp190c [Caulobacter phage Ccr10]ARB14065.1 hypothetical protein Ccr2_gp189c [Caulobacter phage Ccr2]